MPIRNYILLAACILLTACTDPIPASKADYIGHWQGDQMEVWIAADGNFYYERVEGSMTTSIDAPLKEFVGNDFVVGILFFTTTFSVSQPPRQIDGQWQMTVDGVSLTRVSD